eukprot:TRINITY_DN1106_c0_g1_i1.p1 TRINITY_DN1106_c0_g1~~TRINITY_DN1106_c0_g1_i1.p1  ORF type:complete len:572 (-),score=47.85 TRINITY_DN1106_c0_g1_i1:469-1959(-)
MEHAGWKLDVVTYNALIDAYGKAGRCEEVLRLFHRMRREGVPPNVLTLSAVVSALSKAGRHSEAAGLFQQYRDMGLQVDVVVYSAIIDGYGKRGQVEEALAVFRQMLRDGVPPNVVTYNSLIDALGRSAQVTCPQDNKLDHSDASDDEEGEEGRREVGLETALRVFREMKAAGVRPNVVTFSAMLSTCSRLSSWQDAALLLQEMRSACEGTAVAAAPGSVAAGRLEGAGSDCAREGSSSALSSGGASGDVYALAEALLHGHVAHGAEEGGADAEEAVRESPSRGGGGCAVRVLQRGEVDAMFVAVAQLDASTAIAFFNALNDLLWRFNQQAQALRVMGSARRLGVYEGAVWSKGEAAETVLDLHLMSVGAALAMLHLWLHDLTALAQRVQGAEAEGSAAEARDRVPVFPRVANILTGWGKHSKVVGNSIIKRRVEAMLHALASPFRTSASNGGRLTAPGPSVMRWLLQLSASPTNPLLLQDERSLGRSMAAPAAAV